MVTYRKKVQKQIDAGLPGITTEAAHVQARQPELYF